jgi:hypothetical protein
VGRNGIDASRRRVRVDGERGGALNGGGTVAAMRTMAGVTSAPLSLSTDGSAESSESHAAIARAHANIRLAATRGDLAFASRFPANERSLLG